MAKRIGIRMFLRDGRAPRVWETDSIRFEIGVVTLYHQETGEVLAVFKYDDVIGYERVDLGPEPGTLVEIGRGK